MPTTILINAAEQDELRIAILDDNNKIRDLIFEHPEKEDKLHNIYKCVVTGIETSLHAVFVNYGADKSGFLPIKDISPLSFYQSIASVPSQESPAEVSEKISPAHSEFTSETKENIQPNISSGQADVDISDQPSALETRVPEVRVEDIKIGQELIVQVDKEERGNKGAALTGFISLAGRYLVLMPENPQAGGISRRVEGEDRDALKEILKNLKKPADMGVIIRTSGVNKTLEDLQYDLDWLLKRWYAIKKEASLIKRKAPFLIFQESGVVNRFIRDYLTPDIDQIIVDEPHLFEELKERLEFIHPKLLEKLILYPEKDPIFSRYGVEKQIDEVYESSVRLESGGSLVINRTEALFSIDVNSARATRGSSIEETALQINLEAAEEIARQLRLRDIGGLIVIDFIDMISVQHQKEVEAKLRSALRADRARVQIGRISRFGLLEMSRQRLKSSLSEETQITCPRCKGEGHIRSLQSVALSILRVIEEDAIKGQITKIHLQVPVDMAAFFLNEKRKKLVEIEEKYSVKIIVLPNLNLHSPHYQIKREKTLIETEGKIIKSHETLEAYEEINFPKIGGQRKAIKQQQKPAVEFTVSRHGPISPSEESPGLLKRLFSSVSSVFSSSESKTKKEAISPVRTKPYQSRGRSFSNKRSQPRGEHDEQRRSFRGEAVNQQRSAQPKSGQQRGGRSRQYRSRSRKPPVV